MPKIKVALIGNGYLSEIIAKGIKSDLLCSDYELVGVLGKTKNNVLAFSEEHGCTPCYSIKELLNLNPDYIVEAATPEALKEFAEPILKTSTNLIVLSMGAFADKEFHHKVEKLARENDCKIYIASGAIGGLDSIQTITLMDKSSVAMSSKKMPHVLKETKGFDEELLRITEQKEIFVGSAEEAINFMPNGLNVSIAVALAGVGPEDTKLKIYATPNFQGDDYKIVAKNEEVDMELNIYSKTSAIAGWSVIKILKDMVSPIVL